MNRELRSEGVNNAGYLGTFAGAQQGDGQICCFNTSSGNYESIMTWREGRHRRTDALCCKFHAQLTMRGRTQEYTSVACQARDGSWTLMERPWSYICDAPVFSRIRSLEKNALSD